MLGNHSGISWSIVLILETFKNVQKQKKKCFVIILLFSSPKRTRKRRVKGWLILARWLGIRKCSFKKCSEHEKGQDSSRALQNKWKGFREKWRTKQRRWLSSLLSSLQTSYILSIVKFNVRKVLDIFGLKQNMEYFISFKNLFELAP